MHLAFTFCVIKYLRNRLECLSLAIIFSVSSYFYTNLSKLARLSEAFYDFRIFINSAL
jgi:hypothetical protein